MITDRLNTFSDQQAVTATALASNVFDAGPLGGGNLGRDLGAGEGVQCTVLCTAAAAAAGAATVTFTLETDDNTGMSSSTVVYTTAAIPKATLTAGYSFTFTLPAGVAYERYTTLRYTVATGPLTAGTFTAFLHKGRSDIKAYGTGINPGLS